MYSQIAFEKSILKDKQMFKNYCDMLCYIKSITYDISKLDIKKAIYFSASIDMCTALTEEFKKRFPDLDIRRYTKRPKDKDPYKNLIDAQIRFTTIQSGGTAHDIPGLVSAVLLAAIDSPQSNVQSFGRLREIVGDETYFVWLVCDDIQKQVVYHKRKSKHVIPRCKTFREFGYREYI